MTKPTVKAVLTRANELLSDELHWMRGSLAGIIEGGQQVAFDFAEMTEITDDNTQCFCTIGAIARARWELEGKPDVYDSNAYMYTKEYIQPVGECVKEVESPYQHLAKGSMINTDLVWLFNDFEDVYGNVTTFTDVKNVLACAIDKAPDAPPSDQPEPVVPTH